MHSLYWACIKVIVCYIYTGLVDVDDEEDLKIKLLTRKDVWNKKESSYLPKGGMPTFYKHILDKVWNSIKNVMK
jgi:hypothetical protein